MARFKFEDECYYNITKSSTDGMFQKGTSIEVYPGEFIVYMKRHDTKRGPVYERKMLDRFDIEELGDESMDFEAEIDEGMELVGFNFGEFVNSEEYRNRKVIYVDDDDC